MSSFFDKYELCITEELRSPFLNELGVYQDGTTPMYRDVDGKLWAMSGHSHMGHIAMFSGTCLDDMQYAWEIQTNFRIGHADAAFAGIRYPTVFAPEAAFGPLVFISARTRTASFAGFTTKRVGTVKAVHTMRSALAKSPFWIRISATLA